MIICLMSKRLNIEPVFFYSCYPGWYGNSCDQCITHSECKQGTCSIPYGCDCDEGWTGEYCNQCIPAANCVHGTCENPFECECQPGWTGEKCDLREFFYFSS